MPPEDMTDVGTGVLKFVNFKDAPIEIDKRLVTMEQQVREEREKEGKRSKEERERERRKEGREKGKSEEERKIRGRATIGQEMEK